MSITYTYEIIKVDAEARTMEVVYSSEGRQTMHIGARLPFEGESLEAVIQMYAPVAYWREQEAAVVVPELGSGTVEIKDPEPLPPDPKLIGVEFDGVMCSATSQDASGILQIEATIRLTGDALAPMRFQNGSVLRITKDNFAAFMAVWAPFRASFFVE